MSRPQPTVERALRAALAGRSALLLAVSGGIDSVALLHAAAGLQSDLKLRLEAAHVDHGLRPESTADADFVRGLCTQLDIPFHLRRAAAPGAGENVEAWGRRVRYAYFAELLRERELECVLTAHTADDVAETFLMRLVSNKELKSIASWDERRRCLRPFLDVTRQEIEGFAAREHLAFREDASNRDTDLLRNRVRHVLLPLLRESFDPRISEVLSLRAQAVAADIAELYALVEPALAELQGREFGSKAWLRETRRILSELSPGLQWRLAEGLLQDRVGFSLGRSHSERVLQLLRGEVVAVELPGGVELRAKGGGIAYRRADN